MSTFALDLGTTHSGVAIWDTETDSPMLLELPRVCRVPGRAEPLEAPRLVPSATHLCAPEGFLDRLGRWPFFRKRVFWGRHAWIGRQAVERNEGWALPPYAPSFKHALARDPHRTLARLGAHTLSAREVARAFVRELFSEVSEVTGERVRDLVITTPVESFDGYRAELSALVESVGVKRVRFIDEPVAAAIGYGLTTQAQRRVLVIDFGGGTLDLAVVEMSGRETEAGSGRVVAKAGAPLGGDTLDRWLMEHVAKELEIPMDESGLLGTSPAEAELWLRLMLDEARRIKERIYFEDEVTFSITPPPRLRAVSARLGRNRRYLTLTRDEVTEIFRSRGLYDVLTDCVDEVARQLKDADLSEDALDDVLMVGGSTLAPQIYATVEARYGRARVRAWQPFEAVAFGAAAFAADRFTQSDFIVHDYAIVTYGQSAHQAQHTVIVPAGTRFPSAPDLWKRQLVPTCALGEPEQIFKLVICEIARLQDDRRFAWDAEGHLHAAGVDDAPVIVPLNARDPALGQLDPPHQPGDTAPRLEISFGVDANRWLVATVRDLKNRKLLMNGEPVVRLL